MCQLIDYTRKFDVTIKKSDSAEATPNRSHQWVWSMELLDSHGLVLHAFNRGTFWDHFIVVITLFNPLLLLNAIVEFNQTCKKLFYSEWSYGPSILFLINPIFQVSHIQFSLLLPNVLMKFNQSCKDYFTGSDAMQYLFYIWFDRYC